MFPLAHLASLINYIAAVYQLLVMVFLLSMGCKVFHMKGGTVSRKVTIKVSFNFICLEAYDLRKETTGPEKWAVTLDELQNSCAVNKIYGINQASVCAVVCI